MLISKMANTKPAHSKTLLCNVVRNMLDRRTPDGGSKATDNPAWPLYVEHHHAINSNTQRTSVVDRLPLRSCRRQQLPANSLLGGQEAFEPLKLSPTPYTMQMDIGNEGNFCFGMAVDPYDL